MADALKYNKINEELQQKIKDDRENHWVNPYAFKDENAIRRDNSVDKANLWRPVFVRDTEKIMHLPYYNRYADKTQVFSFKNNDDITRRAQHVQLVSRVARNIGSVLGLNLDLIEAIALGHDIGHVPFGHTGEAILNEITYKEEKRYFNHNVQSVRTLMMIENHGLGENLTIQTLDGILCHNGEFVAGEYHPVKKSKEEFLKEYNECYTNKEIIKQLKPMTLEGCVVRISDIIGYVGRDIEDAVRLGVFDKKELPKEITDVLGSDNKTIVNTIVLDLIKNSLNNYFFNLSFFSFYLFLIFLILIFGLVKFLFLLLVQVEFCLQNI